MFVCLPVTLVDCAQTKRGINVASIPCDSPVLLLPNAGWQRLILSPLTFPLKWPIPAFLPRIGQKREFRQNGWTDRYGTRQAGCRLQLSDCVSLGFQCPHAPVYTMPQPHFPHNPVLRAIPAFAGHFVDVCRSSNHLSRIFRIINRRLKYFPKQRPTIVFS